MGYVGLDGGFTILEDETIAPYIDSIKAEAGERGPAAEMDTEAAPAAPADGAAAPMDTE